MPVALVACLAAAVRSRLALRGLPFRDCSLQALRRACALSCRPSRSDSGAAGEAQVKYRGRRPSRSQARQPCGTDTAHVRWALCTEAAVGRQALACVMAVMLSPRVQVVYRPPHRRGFRRFGCFYCSGQRAALHCPTRRGGLMARPHRRRRHHHHQLGKLVRYCITAGSAHCQTAACRPAMTACCPPPTAARFLSSRLTAPSAKRGSWPPPFAPRRRLLLTALITGIVFLQVGSGTRRLEPSAQFITS